MRALLVSPTSAPGGAERSLTALARRLPDHGVTPHAVLLQSGPLEDWLRDAKCDVTILPAGRTRRLITTGRAIMRVSELARECDVVISNHSKGHVYGGIAAELVGRPSVWWQRGIPSRTKLELAAAVIPASLIVCSSRDALEAQRRLTPRRLTRLIHPGVDIEEVNRSRGSGQAIRDANGWRTDTVIGIVGRLQPWKGQEVFLRAAALVVEEHPRTRFVVIGGAILGWEGDYPDRLRVLAARLGIADVVTFAGHQDDIYPWFDAIDIVVHASFREPFGRVLIEAMALGKPLVAAASGGPIEIVETGVSGVLVPPGAEMALARALTDLLDDPAAAEAMGQAARERAKHFSHVRMTEKLVELLQDLRPGRVPMFLTSS